MALVVELGMYKMEIFHLLFADFVFVPCELAVSEKVVQQQEMAHFLGSRVLMPCFLGHSVQEVRSNS